MKTVEMIVDDKKNVAHASDKRCVSLLVACLLIVLLSFNCRAQSSSFINNLRAKLDQYYSEHIPLNLDAQFNQPSFAPGDTAWFSLWLTTEREGLPVADRQIIHVDLLTRSGDIVKQIRVVAKNGTGQGQVVVPSTLEPGIYTVVFSTGWMGHEGPGICGYKEFIVSGGRVLSNISMPLQAHVEGGTLVQNISNELLITGKPGASVSLTAGDAVLHRLALDKVGYGRLTLKPDASLRYEIGDGKEKISLPAAQPGVTMSLSFYDSVSTLKLNLESSQPLSGCNLAIVSRGKLIYSAMVGLQNQTASIVVPRKSLPEGVILATLFDEHNVPLTERMFVANLPSAAFKISPENPLGQPRTSIPVSVESTDPGAMVSVRVYSEDVFPTQGSHNEVVSLARLPIGALDFKVDPSWTLREWNTFLITQRWKKFSWSEVWSEIHRVHAPEKYLRLKGKILQGGNSVFDSVRITFFLRNEARIYEEYVDRAGAFDVDLYFDFYDTEEVIYVIDRRGRVLPGASVALEREDLPNVKFNPFATTSNTDPYTAFTNFRRSVAEAYTTYNKFAGAMPDDDDPNAQVEDELFSADVTVRLDDYILFPDMEETLREIVPKLQHRWRKGHHTVTVALSDPDGLATDEPLYFIDGILTDDTDYFMGLKPEQVATIKIISSHRKLNALGMLGRNGIVLVTTKIPNNRLKVPHSTRSFEVTGLSQSTEYHQMRNVATRTPLLRSSVYFNPSFKLDAAGRGKFELMLPDNVGVFRIEVTGVTKTGALVKTVSHVRSLPPTTTP